MASMLHRDILTLAFVCFVSLSLASRAGVASGEETCQGSTSDHMSKRALLQWKGVSSPGVVDLQGRHRNDNAPSSSRQPADPSTAPLNDAGYQSIAALCCPDDLYIFILRVLAAEGLVVCTPGRLAGFLWWFDCVDDNQNYDAMVQELKAATGGDCAFLAYAGQPCHELNPSCNIGEPIPLPACPAQSTTIEAATPTTVTTTAVVIATRTTTTTVSTSSDKDLLCCAPAPSFLMQKTIAKKPAKAMQKTIAKKPAMALKSSNFVSTSAISSFDCAAHPLPIQVLATSSDATEYMVSELQMQTGQYTQLYTVPLSRTSPPMQLNLNSAGINPIDGIAYATTRLTNDNFYLIRMDATTVEFVASLPGGDGYNVGAFSKSGNYYFCSKGKDQKLYTIKNLHTYSGRDNSPTAGSGALPSLQTEMQSSQVALAQSNRIADIAVETLDLDSTGATEYVFGLARNQKLYIVKSADGTVYKVSASGQGLQPASKNGFGAAWSYDGRIFFASNIGNGVFEVDLTTLDLSAKTVTVKNVGQSSQTTMNDGMNCLNAPSPWPEQGDCADGQVEVKPVNGACPAGSTITQRVEG